MFYRNSYVRNDREEISLLAIYHNVLCYLFTMIEIDSYYLSLLILQILLYYFLYIFYNHELFYHFDLILQIQNQARDL